jgi:calcineurin-like phosphoesterase family protein
LNQLNGRKILIAGNHDQPHPISVHNKGRLPEELAKYARAYRDAGFEAVHLTGAFTLPNFGRVFVTHYPYSDRPDWLRVRLPDDGVTPLLHGHVHDKWRFKGRMLNAGVEVQDYRPMSLREIRDTLRAERAAGWPTAAVPEFELVPDVPANPELPAEERLHIRRWFLMTRNGPLPELPGVECRTVSADGLTLLDAWIDGTNPNAELLWRRCYLSAALTPVASMLLTPFPGGQQRRMSANERVAQLAEPYPHEYQVRIEIPNHEAHDIGKHPNTGNPLAGSEDDRAWTLAVFELPDGVRGTLKRTHRLDANRTKVPGSETAELLLAFPPGRSVNDSCWYAILFHRRLPLREHKPLTLLDAV